MTLEIPVTEGTRYRVDKFDFAGNDKVPADVLRPLFKMKTGDYYNEKRVRDGLREDREIYGAGGHFEMTPLPEFEPDGDKVNVTIRINEGKQYFVNRITFLGNTTTRDNVIRREMRLYENGVFNTEALKFSVRRLNQLGYFKPLEDQKNIQIDKTPGADNKVDVSLKLEEQNRNQLSFGAGVSQYDGVFGQLSFSTANFMGRGETSHALDADRRAASATTRSRSPSRSCSIGRSPDRSTCTSATSSTSISSRRGRRAATSRSDSRWRTSRGCSSTTATTASTCAT